MDAPIRFSMAMIHDHDFSRELKAADIVMTEPTSPEWNPQVAFGSRILRRIVRTNKAKALRGLTLLIDWESEEPEALVAALLVTKGTHELFCGKRETKGGQ